MIRKGVEKIVPPEEQVPFEFLEPEYGVYKDRPLKWANEHFLKEKFPNFSEEEKKTGKDNEILKKVEEIFLDKKRIFPEDTMALLPVLFEVKKEFGVIHKEVLEKIAELFGVAPSFVIGTATFYTMLSGSKKPEIYVCNSLACFLKGAEKIIHKLQEFSEIEVREWVCLGRCEFAPVVHIPFSDSFGLVEEKDLPEIVKILKNKYQK